MAKFTPRELEIKKLSEQGVTQPQIAQELGISLNTVKHHAQFIRIKQRIMDDDLDAEIKAQHTARSGAD